MTLGDKLQKLRKEKCLSQEQLAFHFDVSRQAISKWELSESLPDTDKLLLISKFFNVSTDYLLNDDYDETAISKEISNSHLDEGGKSKPMSLLMYCISTVITAVGFLIIVFAHIDQRSLMYILTGLVIQLVGIGGFESFCCISKLEKAKLFSLHKSYYRVNIWILTLAPIYMLVWQAFRYYPRPYLNIIPNIISILIYIIVCVIGTILLSKKTNN